MIESLDIFRGYGRLPDGSMVTIRSVRHRRNVTISCAEHFTLHSRSSFLFFTLLHITHSNHHTGREASSIFFLCRKRYSGF